MADNEAVSSAGPSHVDGTEISGISPPAPPKPSNISVCPVSVGVPAPIIHGISCTSPRSGSVVSSGDGARSVVYSGDGAGSVISSGGDSAIDVDAGGGAGTVVWPSCDSNTQMWLFVYCRVSIQELIGLSVEDLYRVLEHCNLWHFCARTEYLT